MRMLSARNPVKLTFCVMVCASAYLSCAHSSKQYLNIQEPDSLHVETRLVLKEVFGSLDEFDIRVVARERDERGKTAWKRKGWGYWRKVDPSDSISLSVSSPSSWLLRMHGTQKADSLILRYKNLEGYFDTTRVFKRID